MVPELSSLGEVFRIHHENMGLGRFMLMALRSLSGRKDRDANAEVPGPTAAELKACLVLASKKGSFAAQTVAELRPRGVELVTDLELVPGVIVAVSLLNPFPDARVIRIGRVIRSAVLPGPRWRIECEFAWPLRPDELQQLSSGTPERKRPPAGRDS